MYYVCNARVKEEDMNELIPHLNESDPDDRLVEKGLKELKLLSIPTGCTFLFGGLKLQN